VFRFLSYHKTNATVFIMNPFGGELFVTPIFQRFVDRIGVGDGGKLLFKISGIYVNVIYKSRDKMEGGKF